MLALCQMMNETKSMKCCALDAQARMHAHMHDSDCASRSMFVL